MKIYENELIYKNVYDMVALTGWQPEKKKRYIIKEMKNYEKRLLQY